MKNYLEAAVSHKDKFHRDGTPSLSGFTGEQLRDYYIVVPGEDKPYKIIHKCFATQSIISSKFKGHAPQGIKFYNCYLQNGSAVYLHSIYF